MVTLKIENLDRLRSAFMQAPAKVAPALTKAVIEAGKVLTRNEVMQMPHKTGALQRSVRMDYHPIGVTIYPIMSYAGYIVTGTRPHIIEARRARALRFVGRDGKIHFAKRVMHTGTVANDYVTRTVAVSSKQISVIFDNALKGILKDIS